MVNEGTLVSSSRVYSETAHSDTKKQEKFLFSISEKLGGPGCRAVSRVVQGHLSTLQPRTTRPAVRTNSSNGTRFFFFFFCSFFVCWLVLAHRLL